MRIGGETPGNKEPEILNLGSYCLQVTDKWKNDGKTPDGQAIWREWYDETLDMCQRAQDLNRAAIAKATSQSGAADA